VKATVLLTPPVRTPESYRILPEGCTGCVWRWRTSVLPWRWVRVAANLDCPAAHPDDEAAS